MAINPLIENAESQGAMNEYAETELRRKGKDTLFRIAQSRIVWQLDHVQTARPHDITKLVEGARQVVGRAHSNHLPLPFELLEHLELRAPANQVVHLVDLDSTEEAQRMLCLGPALRCAAGPDLGGDDRLRPASGQSACHGILSPAVHRRGIE